MKSRNMIDIMRMPIQLDADGVMDPMPRLLAVNEMVMDICSEYGYTLLSVDKEMKFHLRDDAVRIISYRMGGSIVRPPDGNGEKQNQAMRLMEENKTYRIAIYCIFERCFNIFLDYDQRCVYAAKYFSRILKTNHVIGRKISKRYNTSRRKYLLNTSMEQMIEGLMLDTTGQYGESISQSEVMDHAKQRVQRVDPKHKYEKWFSLNLLMIYEAYPELVERVNPKIMQWLMDRKNGGETPRKEGGN